MPLATLVVETGNRPAELGVPILTAIAMMLIGHSYWAHARRGPFQEPAAGRPAAGGRAPAAEALCDVINLDAEVARVTGGSRCRHIDEDVEEAAGRLGDAGIVGEAEVRPERGLLVGRQIGAAIGDVDTRLD